MDCCLNMIKNDEKLNKFINWDVLMSKYYPIGGCRIECDVLITKDGSEDLTPAPRTVKDIEAVYRGEITSVDQIKSFL